MSYKCSICGDAVDGDLLTFVGHTEGHIADVIKARHPQWEEKDGLCPKCVEYYRNQLKGKS